MGGNNGATTRRESGDKTSNKESRGGLGGALGGALTAAVLHPIDLIRYRYQVDDKNTKLRPAYTSYLNAFRSVHQHYGSIRGLWTGASTNIAGNMTAWGLYFYFFEHLKSQTQNLKSFTKNSQNFACGTAAGAITLLFTNPIWVVKTQSCLHYSATKQKTVKIRTVVRSIWSTQGVLGFYRGFVPGLFNCIHGGVQMMAYKQIEQLTGLGQKSGGFINGALSKCVAATLLYPIATVKIRLQEQHRAYGTAQEVVTAILREHGIRGFYQGLGLQLLRTVPTSALTFMFYEIFKGVKL